jgi:hypothetical protein
MKSFKQYLAESARTWGYVIKLAIEPTAEQCAAMARYLEQFGLLEISPPEHEAGDSLDFIDIQNHQVYQINFTVKQPLSSYITMEGLRDVLNIAEKLIVVRTVTEPVELNADRHMTELGFAKIAKDDELKPAPRLSTDRLYLDVEQPITTDIYGDAYNKRFLDYLAGVKATRPSDEYHAPAPLFSWLEMAKVAPREPVQDMADFNSRYDTPKPVYKPSSKDVADPTPRSGLGPEGNFDDGAAAIYALMQDSAGKRVNLVAPRAPNKISMMKKD